MLRDRLLPDVFRAFESAEPAYGADPIDEYRDLAMLAHAWERGTLEMEVTEEAPGRIVDAEGNEPAVR